MTLYLGNSEQLYPVLVNYPVLSQTQESASRLEVLMSDPGGVLNLSLDRGVPPGPWNPDPVYDKKFEKILKNWYPVYYFQAKFHSFFLQNACFFRPCLWKIFENLSIWNPVYERTVENHTLKGSTSPCSLSKGIPPPPSRMSDEKEKQSSYRTLPFSTTFPCYFLFQKQ